MTYDVGTSFAAPLVSHKLAAIMSDLRRMELEPRSVLLKAFLVNSARYPVPDGELEPFLDALRADDRKHYLNVLGYGIADAQRATYCDAHAVILYHRGSIAANNIVFLDIPVPAALENADRGTKRLTVTVVHNPDVQRWGLEEYLGTVLKWRMFRGDVARDDVVGAMSTSEDEGEAEQLPNELRFTHGMTIRSRGTVQHDIAEWTTHRAAYSANHYTLAIASYERWGRTNPAPVEFATVVRLEETTQTAEIYSEVENALVALQVRVRT